MIPKVSIIVPVYNSEDYIKRTIKGLLAQTEENIEIILIDDGSIDSSRQICEKYSECNEKIKLIVQENKGASAARNTGIRCAKGEYLAFCDSDDCVSQKWIEHFLKWIDLEESILPICAYCHDIDDLGKQKILKVPAECVLGITEYISFNQEGIAGYIWNALYRRDIVIDNKIFFREKREFGDYNEDLLFSLDYIGHVDKIVYTGFSDYCYLKRPDSMSHTYDNYFEKYKEKYRLWSAFINQLSLEKKQTALIDLSTYIQYHFLLALKEAWKRKDKKRFKQIINSEVVNKCICLADGTKENPFEIKCIRDKKAKFLWIYWMLAMILKKL